jgi:ADP-ribosyl-[dinitrogen reductase] hydrolase
MLTVRPIENSYLVPASALSAGEYPGSPPRTPSAEAKQKLGAFLDAGVRAFVDLTDPADGLAPYEATLQELAAERGITVSYERLTIRDMDVCDPAHMRRVLDAIDARIAEGLGVYVHCWGGIGRTGMVVGCWLVRHGRSGDDALREVDRLFRTMSPAKVRDHNSWGSPQTDAQRAVVREWAGQDHAPIGGDGIRKSSAGEKVRPPLAPQPDVSPRLRDQMRGALIGLAVGDAVGTTVEFRARGSSSPVTDMVGGGPFGLASGQWTDDTSMALCLAESLIECRRFDPRGQMERYVRWWRQGHLSSTGKCFDIGNTVRDALHAFESTGEPFSGPTGEMTAGNGSLMRLAPVPIFFYGRGEDGIALAGESSRTTHGAPVAVDACRYFAALLTGALRGASKADLLSPRYSPEPGYWDAHPLHPVIAAIADGSFRTKPDAAIRGTGYAADALEAALWAFHNGHDFRQGCLLAVNLGDDADTTAAIFGQLAGAFYGESAIPAE